MPTKSRVGAARLAATAAVLVLGIGLLGARRAKADTITQTVLPPGPIPDCCIDVSSPIPINLFDSALGTLNSVTLAGTVAATWYASANVDTEAYTFVGPDYDILGEASVIFPGPAKAMPYVASSDIVGFGSVPDFEGIGTFDLFIGMTDTQEFGPSISSSFSDLVLTYYYTPALTADDPPASVPEPSSLALLLSAVACLGLFRRWKHARG